MSSVTPLEHTAIGGLAGLIEVATMQPTVAVKNCLQEGRPFPRNPAAYYRGLFVRVCKAIVSSSAFVGISLTLFVAVADQCWSYVSNYCDTIWYKSSD